MSAVGGRPDASQRASTSASDPKRTSGAKVATRVCLARPLRKACQGVAASFARQFARGVGGPRCQSAAGRGWVQDMVADYQPASAEGGFLGIGGVQVSDAEKTTLADISKALGRTPQFVLG